MASLRPQPGSGVTIYHDQWGVAHIYAEREENGFFGPAYAAAEDQLHVL
jgi:acyl-homoserine lactone acylase PvdQ